MVSILILDTDIEREVNFIELWDKFFSKQCNLLLSPLLEINENNLHIVNQHTKIIQKKGIRNKLYPTRIYYNPHYSIYYKNIHFIDIVCNVGGWDTTYSIQYKTRFYSCLLFIKYVDVVFDLLRKIPMNIIEIVFDFINNSK